MEQKAHLVVAGINHGLNIGTNVIYSGTVSGAMEGAILGLPAMSVSIDMDYHGKNNHSYQDIFSFPAKCSVMIAGIVVENGLPERTLLNINFPSCAQEEIKGIAITKQGQTVFRDRFEKRLDPRKNVYYWLEGEDEEMETEGGESQDFIAIKKGYISITPLCSDLTNYRCIERLKCWNIPLNTQDTFTLFGQSKR